MINIKANEKGINFQKIYVDISYDEPTDLDKNKSEMFPIPAIQPVSNVDLKRKTSGFGHELIQYIKQKKCITALISLPL